MLKATVHNGVVQLLGLFISLADRIVLIAILVRSWGPQVLAAWLALMAGAALFTAAELSMNVYFGNRWRVLHAACDETSFARLLRISLAIYIALALVLLTTVAVLFLFVDISSLLSIAGLDRKTASKIFLLLSIAQILQITSGSVSQVFRGRGEFVVGQITDASAAALVVGCATLAVTFGADPLHLAIVYVLAQGLGRWSIIYTSLRLYFPSLSLAPARPTRQECLTLAYSIRWLAIIQGAGVLLIQAPVMLLAQFHVRSGALVGFIAIRTLVNFARTFSQFASIAVGIEISGAIAGSGWRAAWGALQQSGRFLTIATGAVTGGVLIFARPMIAGWTGRADFYDPSVLFLLAISSMPVAASLVLQTTLLLANELRTYCFGIAAQVSFSIIISAAVMPSFGVVGLAAGLAGGEFLALGILLPYLGRRLIPIGVCWQLSTLCRGALATLVSSIGGWLILKLLYIPHDLFILRGLVWAIFVALPILVLALPEGIRGRGYDHARIWMRSRTKSSTNDPD